MRISSLFLSALLLFLMPGCHEVKPNTSTESNISNMNIALTTTPEIMQTPTPTIINKPSVAPALAVTGEPQVHSAKSTEKSSNEDGTYHTDYEFFKETINRENSLDYLRREYESIYGRELYMHGCGSYVWKNKPCELSYIEYEDTGPFNAFFLLIDENEDILYISSPIIDNRDDFVVMGDISYLDVDGNGYEDFIIVYGFRTGAGSSHRNPPNLKVAILFGDEGDFYRDYDLEFEVNYKRETTSMDEFDHEYDMDVVIGYLQSKFK